MKFEYTGRHLEVTPAIRAHVEEHFKKIEQLFPDSTATAHVILAVEKNRQMGEILVHWREHTLTARETNNDMYQALSRAIDKIEKQALKLKKKIIDRKHQAESLSQVTARDGQVEPAPRAPRIINARRYRVKPMTPEEASMLLQDVPDQFIVFRDSETNRVGVLYKRKDGNFGLIEP
jgi:putative sigma-54 modulation protein